MKNKQTYNIIGDIHGRSCWKELVKEDSINIFVGDYFDPYERISHERLMQNFRELIAYKEHYPETVLLYGNHDLHYLTSHERASRYSRLHASKYKQIFDDNKHLFSGAAYAIDDAILVTHAGVTKEWYEKEFGQYNGAKPSIIAEEINDQWFHDKMAFTFAVNTCDPYDFSGSAATHSPMWIRPWTLVDHNLFAGTPFKQVFGHTQMDDLAAIEDNLICVDCLGTKVKSLTFCFAI